MSHPLRVALFVSSPHASTTWKKVRSDGSLNGHAEEALNEYPRVGQEPPDKMMTFTTPSRWSW